jgi:hypothetical protein
VAGTPEGAVDLLRRWRLGAGEIPLQAIQQPQRRRIVDGGLRTALDQPMRGLPLPKRPGVRQRGAAGDDAAGRLDVGARVDERVQHLHVVAAGRPVQRRLLVRAAEPGVDLGARLDQERHGRGAVGEVAGPVGGDVQQGA